MRGQIMDEEENEERKGEDGRGDQKMSLEYK